MVYKTTPGGIMDQDYLMHHGIKGQKWGERRFQNPDGSLTPEGMRRYNRYKEKYGEKTANRLMRSMNKGDSEKRAMQREFNRRQYGNVPRKMIPGAVAAVGIGTANTMLYKKLVGNGVSPVSAGMLAGGASYIEGSLIGTILRKADTKLDGYSKFDVSKEGLIKFYAEMSNARDD